MMNRGSVFSGVLAVALWATLSTAEAKLVRYEINGQRYSYSTNNRQQVREARQRIQAAQQAASPPPRNPTSPKRRCLAHPLVAGAFCCRRTAACLFGPRARKAT